MIGVEGMQAFATGVGSGGLPSLKKLWLDENKIGDAGMKHFAAALMSGGGVLSELTSLSIGWNRVGDVGMQALSAALGSGALPSLKEIVVDRYKTMGHPQLVAACRPRGIDVRH